MDQVIFNLKGWRQTFVFVASAIVLTFASTSGLYLLLFGVDFRFWDAATMSIAIAIIVSVPITMVANRQRQRLERLTKRLSNTRRQLQILNKALAQKANFDAMTGLPNREFFFQKFDEMRANSQRNMLLIIDADHFKDINDNFGHPVGDRALKMIAAVLKRKVRRTDLVGRIGGEEFGILLPATSEGEGLIIAEMIRCEIANMIFEPQMGMRHVLTVSIGLAPASSEVDRAIPMRNADCALFQAKRDGRNICRVYISGMGGKPGPRYPTTTPRIAPYSPAGSLQQIISRSLG